MQSLFAEASRQAAALIVSGDTELWGTAFFSVWLAGVSTLISALVGVPAGFLLASRRFPLRDSLVTLMNTMLALPTVVVGLLVYSLVRRGSPLGALDLLFSPSAMVIGQAVLAVPITTVLTHSAVSSLGPAVRETAVTLGAAPRQVFLTVAWEARVAVLAAIAAAGGRLIGEVGVSMMLGGNIRGYTRTLTTAIAMETGKGEFAFALALGFILLALALLLNLFLVRMKSAGESLR